MAVTRSLARMMGVVVLVLARARLAARRWLIGGFDAGADAEGVVD